MLSLKLTLWFLGDSSRHIAGSAVQYFQGKQIVKNHFKFSCLAPLLSIFMAFFTPAYADDEISSKLIISGLEESRFSEMRKTFDAASLLKAPASKVLVSAANLRAKIKSDATLMTRILRAEGYYASSVVTRLARSGNSFTVNFDVTLGPLYHFGKVEFDYAAPVPSTAMQNQLEQTVGLSPSLPAIAKTFVAAEAKIAVALPELGFPFAEAVRHELIVDHRTQTMNILFSVNTGERMRLGRIQYQGLKSVKETYLEQFSEWQQNDFFEQKIIDTLRSRLLKTGLFANVILDITPANNTHVNIDITVSEAPHRTIGATAGYSTAEGIGGELSWEHRNVFGRGGIATITARGAEIEQSLAGRLELPNFARLDQTLSFESLIRRQNTDAFLSYEAEVRAGIDRVLTPNLAVLAGGVLEFSDVTDVQGDRDFLLASLPIGARWDSSDDLLNPSKGLRASLVTAPSINLGSTGFSFLKSEFKASTYFSPLRDQKMTLALRTRFGSIVGAANNTLPATQRFFAGGGGSIRGFAFQQVGPLGADNNPLGGRSVAEIAGEVRLRVSDTIGIVPFIEGGNTYVDNLPKFSDFRWGAGIGARYYTSFGPIRFDFAVPLDRRPGEGRLQFYVSLGQAF